MLCMPDRNALRQALTFEREIPPDVGGICKPVMEYLIQTWI